MSLHWPSSAWFPATCRSRRDDRTDSVVSSVFMDDLFENMLDASETREDLDEAILLWSLFALLSDFAL
jgi:hypothetical protein